MCSALPDPLTSDLVQFLKAGHLLHFPIIASKQEYTVTGQYYTYIMLRCLYIITVSVSCA